MTTEERRQALRTGARTLVAAAIGALAVKLGLARRTKRADEGEGYCDRAGRCGGCQVTAGCDVYRSTHGGQGHG